MNQKNVRTWCSFLSTLIRIVKSIHHVDRLSNVLVIIGLSIIFIMLLFPPFHVMYSPGIEINMGYAFVLNPPAFWESVQSTMNISTLLFQIGAVMALLVASQLFLKMYKK